jgi:hypothetical protein
VCAADRFETGQQAAELPSYRESAIAVVEDNLHIAGDGCMPSTLLRHHRTTAVAHVNATCVKLQRADRFMVLDVARYVQQLLLLVMLMLMDCTLPLLLPWLAFL